MLRLAYDSLFILAAGGSGGGDLNYTVHFSDASIKTGLISVDDWFCNACATYAITGLSEVDRATGSKIGINEYTIKEYPVFFTGGDENKQIVSIDFSVPSGAPGTVNIFGITAYIQGSLPVTLQYFNVTPVNGKAVLQWKTSQEFNNNKFIIERASANNPSNFINIGAVNATSSATGSLYSFTNDAVVSGTYLYRLLQKDINGNVRVLGTKSITLNTKIKWLIQDMGTQWQLISPSAFTYRIIDMNGRLLQAASGTGSATITKPFAHGIYEIGVQVAGEFSTQKLIK